MSHIPELIITVKYMKQADQKTCWNASYKMMLNYKKGVAGESEADNLPNDTEMRDRGIYDSEFPTCRNALKMSSTVYSGFKTASGINDKLTMYGPIWCSGFWADGHKHIVVLCGVREGYISAPEVFVNDPARALSGAQGRGAWWSLGKFANHLNPVPYACQHWA
jgi:hypothetical protein